MKQFLRFLIIGCLLLAPFYPLQAEEESAASQYQETPNVFRLFLDQWSGIPGPPGKYSLEFLRTADEETKEVTLKEAVWIGLKNNPGILVERLEPLRAAEDTLIEWSAFDPTMTLEFNKDFTIDPRGSRSAAFSAALQRTRNTNYNLSLSKLLRTGTEFEISFLNNRFISSFPTQVLKPQYRPELRFSIVQPLLRDLGWGLTTIRVRIAENNEGKSLFDYETRLARLVQRITENYWNVVFAKENLTVQKKGVELAQALLVGAEARARAGALPPVAVTEARAEKARREELVIIAENEFDIARKELQLTLNLNPENRFFPRHIEPVEEPSVLAFDVDRMESREAALRNRSEMLAAQMEVQNRSLEVRAAGNELLPRLDFQASVGLTGLAGKLKPTETNPFPGNYGSAFDRLGSGEFYDYSLALVLEIPIGNAEARGNFSKARIELNQAKARLRDLVAQVTLEVERAAGEVKANFQRIQATRLSRQLAEENLRAQERRFQIGLVTQKDLIDFQSRFLEARGAELRAIIDYNNSLSGLRLSEGSLLDHNDIKIEGKKEASVPWWARF